MSNKIFEVADFFLANADKDDSITPVKLQKLCVYAQAYSLALRGKPLFDEDLEESKAGPVVRSLSEKYKNRRSRLRTTTKREASRRPFTPEELYVLETVNGYYGGYAPQRLRDMSCIDFPGNSKKVKKSIITKKVEKSIITNDSVRKKFARHKAIKTIDKAFS